MQLLKFISDENIDSNFKAENKEDALKKLANLVVKGRNLNYDKILQVLKEREELGSTGIGHGVAIPHGKFEMDEDLIGAIAISKEGVEFEAIDEKPVNIFFVFISSPEATNLHLKVLAKVSKLLMDDNFRTSLINANSKEEIKKLIS